MKNAPIWALDFDGVVSPLLEGRDIDDTWHDWTKVRAGGFEMYYSPTLIDFITRCVAAGVEVTWLSTWEDSITSIHRDFENFAPLPWINRVRTDTGWWKLAAVQRMDADRPLVWTDDDLDKDEVDEDADPGDLTSQVSSARQFLIRRGNALGIAPVSYTGLTPSNLARISAFLWEAGIDVPLRARTPRS